MDKVLGFILAFPAGLLRAWVFCVGWAWFVVPAFGIATPPVVAAWGILMLISMVMPGTLTDGLQLAEMNKDNDYAGLVTPILSVAVSLMFLFLMWIVQLFM